MSSGALFGIEVQPNPRVDIAWMKVAGRRDDLPVNAPNGDDGLNRAGGTEGQRKGPNRLVLGVGAGVEFQDLAVLDGRYLSTEVAGGFTGRVVGMEALGADAILSRFTYTP